MAPKEEEPFQIYTYADLVGNLNDFLKSSEICVNNDSWVNFLLNETLNCWENFTGKDNNRCGTITDFLILSSSKLNHTLGSWMLDINLK